MKSNVVYSFRLPLEGKVVKLKCHLVFSGKKANVCVLVLSFMLYIYYFFVISVFCERLHDSYCKVALRVRHYTRIRISLCCEF